MTLISLIYCILHIVILSFDTLGFFVIFKKTKQWIMFWIMLMFAFDLLDQSINFIGDILPQYDYTRTAGITNNIIVVLLSESVTVICFYILRRITALAAGLKVTRTESIIWAIVCIAILMIKLSSLSNNKVMMVLILCIKIAMYGFSLISAMLSIHRSRKISPRKNYLFWMIIMGATLFLYLIGAVGSILLVEGIKSLTQATTGIIWNSYALIGLAYMVIIIRKQPGIDYDLSILNARRRFNLTDREGEILKLILLGKSNSEICGELCIAEGTVKTHIHNICQKTGTSRRREIKEIIERL